MTRTADSRAATREDPGVFREEIDATLEAMLLLRAEDVSNQLALARKVLETCLAAVLNRHGIRPPSTATVATLVEPLRKKRMWPSDLELPLQIIQQMGNRGAHAPQPGRGIEPRLGRSALLCVGIFVEWMHQQTGLPLSERTRALLARLVARQGHPESDDERSLARTYDTLHGVRRDSIPGSPARAQTAGLPRRRWIKDASVGLLAGAALAGAALLLWAVVDARRSAGSAPAPIQTAAASNARWAAQPVPPCDPRTQIDVGTGCLSGLMARDAHLEGTGVPRGNDRGCPREGRDVAGCITQAEAQHVCETRGGRLPTVEEWDRAASVAGTLNFHTARREWSATPDPTAPGAFRVVAGRDGGPDRGPPKALAWETRAADTLHPGLGFRCVMPKR